MFQNAPIPQAVLRNILPAMAAMMMVLIYNLADTFFIAQTKNDILVAAVSLTTPYIPYIYEHRNYLWNRRDFGDIPCRRTGMDRIC